jgi:protein-tyrosine phosphatase
MAEAILRSKKIEGLEVRSAGVFAANGSEASAHAKTVLDDNRISHQHSSSLLTNETVEWAELILTMTASHKAAILRQFPGAAVKLFTLKEFTGEAVDHDVVDPYGGTLAMYRETYKELDRLIEKALEKIKP